jgi:signal transduction histidine kinase
LGLVFGLTSGVALIALGLSVYCLVDRYVQARAREDLATLAGFYAAHASILAGDQASLAALASEIAGTFAPQADYDVRIFGSGNGSLLAASRDLGPLPSSAALVELGYRWPTLFVAASRDLPDRIYAARSVRSADGTALAVVEVSRDVGEMRAFLGVLRLVLAGAGAVTLLAGGSASFALARRMTHPLREVEAATEAIAEGDLDHRLAVPSEDEVGRLADSVNRMAAELARLQATRRDFIARISHDLRTPLTAIKGLVVNLQDVAPEGMQPTLVTLDEQADRLIRLVNDLLTLSRLQRGALRLQGLQVELVPVTSAAVSLVRSKAQSVGIELSLDLPEGLPTVYGDPDRLQQVVVNLLDNALRATPVGGEIRVQAFATEEEVVLTVLDRGRGLTDEEAGRAFEPYYRGPEGGAGLGLSIAREIILALGGRIWLEPRPGGGAEAGFSLPRFPP